MQGSEGGRKGGGKKKEGQWSLDMKERQMHEGIRRGKKICDEEDEEEKER